MSKVIELAGYGVGKRSTTSEHFAFPISIQKVRSSYRVVYGKAIHADLNYSDACRELGAAIMHALQCDGAFDTEDK